MEFAIKILNAIKEWREEKTNFTILSIFKEESIKNKIENEVLDEINYCIEEKNIINLEELLKEIEEKIKGQAKRESLDYHLTKKVHYSEMDYSVRYLIEEFANKRMRMPKFQRAYVWEETQVGEFILSLLRGIPIPKLYGYSEYDEETKKNIKLIIDGQQRLTSVLMWYYGIYPKYKIRKINYSEHMTEIVKYSNYYYEPDVYKKEADRLEDELERKKMIEDIKNSKIILEQKYKLTLDFEFKVRIIDENNAGKEIDISYRGKNSILTPKEKEDLLDKELGFVLVKGGKNSETVDIFRLYNSSGTPLSSQEIRNGIHYRNPLYKAINDYNDETGRIPGTRDVKNEKWNFIRNKGTDKNDVKQLFLMLACYFNLTYIKNENGDFIKNDRIKTIITTESDLEILDDKIEDLIDLYSDFISENGNNKELLENEFSSIKDFFSVDFQDYMNTNKNFKNYIIFYIILRYLGKLNSNIIIPKRVLEYKHQSDDIFNGYLNVKYFREIFKLLKEEGVI